MAGQASLWPRVWEQRVGGPIDCGVLYLAVNVEEGLWTTERGVCQWVGWVSNFGRLSGVV